MANLGTSLSYTSNLYGSIEWRTETPLRFVAGMPAREKYEADQGWDELFAVKPPKPLVRRGASAAEGAVERETPAARRDRDADDLEV